MSEFVMSGEYPCFCEQLQKKGYKVIKSDIIKEFLLPEQQHADMQILPIKNKLFVLNECKGLQNNLKQKNPVICQKNINNKYPDNIILNFLFLNNCLYGKMSALDSKVDEFCRKNNIELVNINQGYARCSTLVLNNKAVITSDKSIEKALMKNGVEVLLISAGNIELNGFDYGFIGGAGGKLNNNTIVFFGDAARHPDYNLIDNFCKKHNLKIEILCKQYPLTDIGGIVKI